MTRPIGCAWSFAALEYYSLESLELVQELLYWYKLVLPVV
jgi:hypothetical protein